MKQTTPKHLSWNNIDETVWKPHINRVIKNRNLSFVRVKPGMPEYEEIIDLRFRGLVESGFLNAETDSPDSMRLQRDEHSIIVGAKLNGRIISTVTMNTLCETYPVMAMEEEKKVRLDHPAFHSPDLIEFVKLIIDPHARQIMDLMHLLTVVGIVARVAGKVHFWQVSRDLRSDIRWRQKFGFTYLDYRFNDPSLNFMPSRIGYAYFPEILDSPYIPRPIRKIYRLISIIPLS
ncbi:MAG: hypothetical protein K9L68_01395 [Spirochaetales bacterium]|nr:hypothetical protein [Spirochaetales bacterium]